MRPEDDSQWHLDKRVPITIILALLIQTASTVWWAAGVSARVDILERERPTTIAALQRLDSSREDMNLRLTRIQDSVDALLEIARRRDKPIP